MRVIRAVWTRGGVATVRGLLDAGISRYELGRAIDAGDVVRVRRGWIAAPRADPALVAAARSGVVLSCVTQAKRLKLWVLDEGLTHVAARAHSGRVAAQGCVVHWSRPLIARPPDALADPVENVLAIVAACQPHEHALAVWESALRRELVDRSALARLPFSAAARRVLDCATPFSDSGLESFVIPRLRWMRLSIVPQVWIAGHVVDFLIGDRLVLQIDGGHHTGAQREADIAHDARLRLMGYTVIRVGYGQVVNGWPAVQAVILRAVAQGLHKSPDDVSRHRDFGGARHFGG